MEITSELIKQEIDKIPKKYYNLLFNVLRSFEAEEKVKKVKSKESIVDFFRKSPLAAVDLDLNREIDLGREVDL